MPLNTSGPISLGGATAGQSINLELSQPATSTVALNDTNVRTLAGVPGVATQIVMPTDFYGKPIASGYAIWIRMSPNRVVNNGGDIENRLNVVKTPDDFIVRFYSRGQGSFPTGAYTPGINATLRINEPTGNIAWIDQYTYANTPVSPGPAAPGNTTLQTATMGLNPPGSSVIQYDAFTNNRPPVSDIQGYWTQTQIIKNFSNGVPTSFNMAPNVFARTSLTGWNFANGNTLIRYPTTFPLPSQAAIGTYIQNPSGTGIGNPYRYSPVISPGGVGTALQRVFYADNTTKTDVISTYSGLAIPPGTTAVSTPATSARNFTHYTRFTQDGTVVYSRWIANGAFLAGTPGAQTVLASPPALSYHVGIKQFNANFPNTTGSLPANNNILFWKYNKTDGAFTGNVFYWSNQPTTPGALSTFPFSPTNLGVGINSSLSSTGRFCNIYPGNTTGDIFLRIFDSDPTFNNVASFIVAGSQSGTVINPGYGSGSTLTGLNFWSNDHSSENFGNQIIEEGNFIYLIFCFASQGQVNPSLPWDVCILKTQKDFSGITNGLTVTSPAFNRTITFTSTPNRPLYETAGWVGGTLDRDVGFNLAPAFNIGAPRINETTATYSSQKVV